MKYLIFFFFIFLISCGGGSSGTPLPGNDPIPNANSGSELSLLPGSVNSFQPLDIDD